MHIIHTKEQRAWRAISRGGHGKERQQAHMGPRKDNASRGAALRKRCCVQRLRVPEKVSGRGVGVDRQILSSTGWWWP